MNLQRKLSIFFYLLLFVLLISGVLISLFFKIDEYVDAKGVIEFVEETKIYSKMDGTVVDIYKGYGETLKKDEIICKIENDNIEVEKNRIELLVKEIEIEMLELIRKEKNYKESLIGLKLEKQENTKKIEANEYMLESETLSKSNYELNNLNLLISQNKIANEIMEKEFWINDFYNLKWEQLEYKKNENIKKIKKLQRIIYEGVVKSEKNNIIILTEGFSNLKGSFVNKGDFLCMLGDKNSWIFKVEIKENYIDKIKISQSALIFIDVIFNETNTPYKGKVLEIDEIKNKNECYSVKIKLKKDDKEEAHAFMKGFSGKAKIIVKEKVRLLDFIIENFIK